MLIGEGEFSPAFATRDPVCRCRGESRVLFVPLVDGGERAEE